MILRRPAYLLLSLLVLPIAISLAGCNSLQSIAITPAAGATVLNAVGQTAQFTAIASSQFGSATPTTSNLTSSVSWSVSNPSVATINSSGLATAVGSGYTQVIAQSNGIIATSDITVTIVAGNTGVVTPTPTVTSIAVIPGAQSVASPTQTSQFIAIGTTSTGGTLNLTNLATWSSSSAQIATVAANGLATAVGAGTATITALYTNTTGGNTVVGTGTFTVTGGTTEKYVALTVTPSTQALSASGLTGQFIALATSGTSGLETDVTSSAQLKWSSSAPAVASTNATGLVTALSAGTTTVTAELTNTDGTVVSSTGTVTVTLTGTAENFLSLMIIPSSITVGNLQDTGQFLAIGTFATPPYVRDLTNSSTLTWITSAPSVFPVNTNTAGTPGASAGIVSAYGNGSAEIIAEATSSDGTIQTATAEFNCPLILPTSTTAGSCYPGSQAAALLATLTVYNEGLNTTTWLVTAPSATGTPNVLHCGPGS